MACESLLAILGTLMKISKNHRLRKWIFNVDDNTWLLASWNIAHSQNEKSGIPIYFAILLGIFPVRFFHPHSIPSFVTQIPVSGDLSHVQVYSSNDLIAKRLRGIRRMRLSTITQLIVISRHFHDLRMCKRMYGSRMRTWSSINRVRSSRAGGRAARKRVKPIIV